MVETIKKRKNRREPISSIFHGDRRTFTSVFTVTNAVREQGWAPPKGRIGEGWPGDGWTSRYSLTVVLDGVSVARARCPRPARDEAFLSAMPARLGRMALTTQATDPTLRTEAQGGGKFHTSNEGRIGNFEGPLTHTMNLSDECR